MEELHPRNFMTEQQKKNVSELQGEKNPMPSTFVCCKTKFNTDVSGSGHPAEALPWIKDVEMANSADDLKTSRSILGRIYLNFETLDARIASALKKTVLSSNFKRKAHLEEQKAQTEDRFLRGRKIA